MNDSSTFAMSSTGGYICWAFQNPGSAFSSHLEKETWSCIDYLDSRCYRKMVDIFVNICPIFVVYLWKPGLTARRRMQLGEPGQHLYHFMQKRDDSPSPVTFIHPIHKRLGIVILKKTSQEYNRLSAWIEGRCSDICCQCNCGLHCSDLHRVGAKSLYRDWK